MATPEGAGGRWLSGASRSGGRRPRGAQRGRAHLAADRRCPEARRQRRRQATRPWSGPLNRRSTTAVTGTADRVADSGPAGPSSRSMSVDRQELPTTPMSISDRRSLHLSSRVQRKKIRKGAEGGALGYTSIHSIIAFERVRSAASNRIAQRHPWLRHYKDNGKLSYRWRFRVAKTINDAALFGSNHALFAQL